MIQLVRCESKYTGKYCDKCNDNNTYNWPACNVTCNADSTSALDADSTCSGNGICLENGTCQCNDGYYGTDCSNVGYDFTFNGKF